MVVCLCLWCCACRRVRRIVRSSVRCLVRRLEAWNIRQRRFLFIIRMANCWSQGYFLKKLTSSRRQGGINNIAIVQMNEYCQLWPNERRVWGCWTASEILSKAMLSRARQMRNIKKEKAYRQNYSSRQLESPYQSRGAPSTFQHQGPARVVLAELFWGISLAGHTGSLERPSEAGSLQDHKRP